MTHQRNNGSTAVCGAPGGRRVRSRGRVDCPACLALPVPVMGRPARAGVASGLIALRVTDDERQCWTTEADRAGLSLSEWIRVTCSREARERTVY